ncbi:flagellar hook-length control protein FliK [Roseovarius faecimaris]|nr:flagellar hook-length control protein FliK [Roseovarius faecimaris]
MQAAPEQRQPGDSWQPGQAGRLLAALHAAPNAALNGDPKGMSVAVEVQAQQATQHVAQAQPATLSLQGAASGAPSLVPTPAAARDPAGDGPLQVDELRLSAEPGTAPLRPVAAGHLQRPGTPPHIAAQIAGAIQRGGPNPTIDLSLNPAELGRVKISLQPSDGVVLVHVVADRGETLDLLRRHAEQLAQEFHSIGYGEAQFSFSRQSSDQGPANEAGPHVEGSREHPLAPGEGTPLPRPSIGLTMSDRVDIRV